MKKMFLYSLIFMTAMSCTNSPEKGKNRLEEAVESGRIMYGHEDTYFYGHSWRADSTGSFRSDIKDVCGRHAAVMGMDLGGQEYSSRINIDGTPFGYIAAAAVEHHSQGGVVTASWHIRNLLTGGDSWDVSSKEAVKSVLPGGEKHDAFMEALDNAAAFMGSLKDADGNLIPLVFRPWHEHTGSWFWWGRDLCSVDEYKALWHLTHDYLVEEKGLDNLIWAYSPNLGVDAEGYMERYPGDEYVDLLGWDAYQFGSNEEFTATLSRDLAMLTELGKKHNKVIALTETGFEGIPFGKWWTEVLYPAIEQYPVAYVLTWRNASDRPDHFFGPWKGALCEEDFIEFSNLPKIKML